MTGRLDLLRRWARAVRRRVRPSALERRIMALDLRPGDVAIDCGANVGEVTIALARTGAFVHAFEPDPAAFEVLAERLRHVPNVCLHPQAVLDRGGAARLYFHVDARRDRVAASIGSSLLAHKGNVDPNTYVDVEVIDLADFVFGLERPVKVVKIDVEGVECPIVHRLLDTGAIDRVGTVLVELHDRHIPQLGAENDRLRARIELEGLTSRVLTDWV